MYGKIKENLGKQLQELKNAGLYKDERVIQTPLSYPVVPKGLARIRVQISAAHNKEHLDKAIDAFTGIGKKLKVIN